VEAAKEMLQEKAIRMKKLRDDVLLEKVTLPRATRTFLQRAGFKTVGDVRRASADSLVAVRGLGRQSYTAIHKVIGIPEMAKRWRLEEESG
jgi:DNA-directed RNA polymerase alpha subunit